MHTTQYSDSVVSYREGFDMNTGIKNPAVVDEDLSFSQPPTSPAFVFDSTKMKITFLP